MNVHIDMVIQYGTSIDNADLPDNWAGMGHEEKDEWVREWIEQYESTVPFDVIDDHRDITWYEGGN